MDLSWGPEYEAFRAEVKEFLAAHWPLRGAEAELPRARQVALLRERATLRGYLCRNVPRRLGGSEQPADALRAQIIREEFARARAPGEARGIGPSMFVPTLLEWGQEWQKEKWVRSTITGETIWCQGYSEPGSGSDLASLQTRGELRDGEWIVNGQKVWTTGAHLAHYIFALVRTEPDAPKHAGISYLLLDMRQPGIEVRPLRQMTGGASFNQVFFTDARTPADWIVGERGQGWQVSRTTLEHERNSIGSSAQTTALFESLVRLARSTSRRGRPALEDPEIRQRLAALEGHVRAHQCSGWRQLTRDARGQDPGILALMNKLISTNIGHEVARIALDLLGDEGLLAPGEREVGVVPRGGAAWLAQVMGSLGSAIAGGTANIQRNIIAERGLGLPRDAAAQRSGAR